MENVIKMHGTGHNGRLPPVVERASSGCAHHGGMVAELRGGGKDFGSEIKARSGKSWEQKRTTNCEKQSVGCLSNTRAWERSLAALAARNHCKFEARFALPL